jgi:hypothetical protein
MKRNLSILFTLLTARTFAGTGSANDGLIFFFAIVIIMSLIVGAGKFINLLSKGIKAVRTWNWIHKHTENPEEKCPDTSQQFDFPVLPAFQE